MQRWDGVAEAQGLTASVVTIGTFDGVHRGHRHVIGAATERAEALGIPSVVLTFEPHPVAVVRPGSEPARLTGPRHKAALIEALGVTALCTQPFTKEFSALPPAEFVSSVLVEALRAHVVVVGENFRFGHRAAGDVAALRTLGAGHFEVAPVPLVGDGDHRWSSTGARERLAAGDVAGAAEVLGRPHRVEGEVVRGDGRGRQLGYPTANLALAAGVAVPADGVYAGWLVRGLGGGEQRLPAAISVGTNPTFDGVGRRVEAYVLDAELELYGEVVGVEFGLRLRGMERFDGVEALVAQVGRDVATTRELLA